LFKNWLAFKNMQFFKNILILKIRINKQKKVNWKRKKKAVGPIQTDDAADREELPA
jgi:hypothetical protein